MGEGRGELGPALQRIAALAGLTLHILSFAGCQPFAQPYAENLPSMATRKANEINGHTMPNCLCRKY
jgi:hypothetical protein